MVNIDSDSVAWAGFNAVAWLAVSWYCSDCDCWLQVGTDKSDGSVTNGDPVRCPACGATGNWNCDAEGYSKPIMNYAE